MQCLEVVSKDNEVKVIEANVRASRTFPFVSKTLKVDFIEIATRVMAGAAVHPAQISLLDLDYVGIKAPMFSFARLRGADPALGVEMSSTGEVACFGRDKEEAFLKALLSTTMKVPTAGSGDTVLVSFAAPLAHRALGPAFQRHWSAGGGVTHHGRRRHLPQLGHAAPEQRRGQGRRIAADAAGG